MLKKKDKIIRNLGTAAMQIDKPIDLKRYKVELTYVVASCNIK